MDIVLCSEWPGGESPTAVLWHNSPFTRDVYRKFEMVFAIRL